MFRPPLFLVPENTGAALTEHNRIGGPVRLGLPLQVLPFPSPPSHMSNYGQNMANPVRVVKGVVFSFP